MTLKQRRQAFVQLGSFIDRHFSKTYDPKEERFHNDLTKIIDISFSYNGWFTTDEIERALKGISFMLTEDRVSAFSADVKEPAKINTVAVIMAGNIPAVGFHDMLCVLLSGQNILIKVSSDDPALIPFLAGMLIYYEPAFAPAINFSEARLNNFDAVIATGSNNSAKHFEYYFGKYPHIIRKNRSSIAILNGKETTGELHALGKDLFYYYGLGCRNVSKVFVPANYDFTAFFEAIFPFNYVSNNKKYFNNHEYNRAIYLLDQIPFLDNNFLMLRESTDLHAPTSVLYHEAYTNETELVEKIKGMEDNLQCIVSNFKPAGLTITAFGKTQQPDIFDFADNVNTLNFLNTL